MKRIVAVLVLLIAMPVWAAAPDALPEGGRGKVAVVIDGDTVRLEGIKADVRLVGIQAPKLPLGRKGFKTWPLADTAKTALADIVKGHTLTLRLGTQAQDRNGRILAHIVRDDGVWVHEEMLRRGFARVYTFPDNRQLAAELFAAERAGRAQRAGIWADATYALRAPDPEALAKEAVTFQIIEGRVAGTAKVQGRIFLNFGADYRTDFTATIVPESVGMFAKSGIDPLTLKDKVIRVRGYLRNYNGPTMDITHPEQIEIEIAP